MSLIRKAKCIVDGCRYNLNPVYADRIQVKTHLLRDHDYKEKQEIAAKLGLITPEERRSPQWLADNLSESCFQNGVF